MKICARCSELFPDEASYCANDGTILERNTDRFLGRTIASRYRLVRRLGAGGMSIVYLARHELIARLSALKILRPELSLVTEHRERFLREARAVNRINHENIVEITDVGESDGIAYLVMEYVDGEPLASWIQRGALPWELGVRIGMQIANALARAHQMGIVHRDLKPENILLQSRHRNAFNDVLDMDDVMVKLTDFGIAKIVGEASLTLNEQLFGTPGYIAPEYVNGFEIDGRADIYSLAVVIYEMVTGKLPFDGRGQSELLFKPLTSPPVPPSRRTPGLPTALEELLLRCLSTTPDERPKDAFVVHDALKDILVRHGTTRESVVRPSSLPISSARADLATEVDLAPRGSASRDERGAEGALAELETRVEAASKLGGNVARAADRAAELATLAKEMTARMRRASNVVKDQQAIVDELEERGRAFRIDLGHAIDVLVHDRSRERERLDAVRRSSSDDDVGRARQSDRAEQAAHAIADLTFQIDALQAQLEAKNEAFERELMLATGTLEGSLSALRRLQREAFRTIEDGLSVLERAS